MGMLKSVPVALGPVQIAAGSLYDRALDCLIVPSPISSTMASLAETTCLGSNLARHADFSAIFKFWA